MAAASALFPGDPITLPDLPPPTVEAVVVRAARLPPSPGDAAFSVVTLTPERIAARERLDEAISQVPGAALFRRTSSAGANPTTQGVSLREIAPSGAGRALVTLDGAPQNDPFGGWVIWTALPPEGIAGATIVRGAGAGPYGAGALTGVVALDGPGAGSGSRADLAAGELGFRRAGAALDGTVGGADLLLVGSAEHDDGWVPVRERRGAADERLSLDARNLSGRVQADVGTATLAARAGTFVEQRDSGLAGAASRASGSFGEVTLARPPGQGSEGWRVQAWVRTSNLRNSSVAVASDRSATTPANDQYATPALGYGFNAALRGRSGAARWEIGGDLRAAEGESRERFRYMAGAFTRDRTAGGRTLVFGAYAEGEQTVGDWLLTAGARLDRWSSTDAHRREIDLATGAVTLDAPTADRDGVVPTARAGARRALDDGWYVRAAAYAGFRPPTLNELHRPFRVGNDITEANATLEPEKLYGLEAAVGRERPGWTWSLAAFANRLSDPVTNVTVGIGPGTFPIAGFIPAGGTLRQRQNAGRIDAVGLEFEDRHRLGPVTLSGAATWTVAKVDGGSAAPQLTGLRPAQAPRLSAAAGADWAASARLTLSAALRYESARFEDDLNSRRLAAATTLDLRADWKATDAVGLYLAVDNVADEAVQTGQTADGVTSYAPPMAARIGVRWGW